MRDAVVADTFDEMEVTIETHAQEAEENEVEVNAVTASPLSLAQFVRYVPSKFRNQLLYVLARCE